MPIRGVKLVKLVCGVQKLKLKKRARSFSDSDSSTSSTSSRHSNCGLLSDDESFTASDIPERHLAVYVGEEKRRFIVKTEYLNTRPFRALLDKCAQEFGFSHIGGLTIPCQVHLFEHMLWLLNNSDPAAELLEMEELIHLDST